MFVDLIVRANDHGICDVSWTVCPACVTDRVSNPTTVLFRVFRHIYLIWTLTDCRQCLGHIHYPISPSTDHSNIKLEYYDHHNDAWTQEPPSEAPPTGPRHQQNKRWVLLRTPTLLRCFLILTRGYSLRRIGSEILLFQCTIKASF